MCEFLLIGLLTCVLFGFIWNMNLETFKFFLSSCIYSFKIKKCVRVTFNRKKHGRNMIVENIVKGAKGTKVHS
jgi:hypothetical protein